MTLTNDAVFRMSDFVGGGYSDFWKFKGRYRIVKGSRASKKSKTAALWYISNLSKEKYKDLWFMWDGKPMIMAHPKSLNKRDP